DGQLPSSETILSPPAPHPAIVRHNIPRNQGRNKLPPPNLVYVLVHGPRLSCPTHGHLPLGAPSAQGAYNTTHTRRQRGRSPKDRPTMLTPSQLHTSGGFRHFRTPCLRSDIGK
ncbi:hypothetical protein HAX54_001838, partial [Datura stramonium]|nr:hypothetical protein [Datura stramonium]